MEHPKELLYCKTSGLKFAILSELERNFHDPEWEYKFKSISQYRRWLLIRRHNKAIKLMKVAFYPIEFIQIREDYVETLKKMNSNLRLKENESLDRSYGGTGCRTFGEVMAILCLALIFRIITQTVIFFKTPSVKQDRSQK